MSQVRDRLAWRVRQLALLDIPGGGQVVVDGDHVFIGHMNPPHGTTVVNVSDRKNPRIVAEIKLETDESHTHKVRVIGDLMITNVEQNDRHFKRRANGIATAENALKAELGRSPTDGEVAKRIGVNAEDLPRLRQARLKGYAEGGFRIWDISNRSKPRPITHHRTHGVGVHRFDADEHYAYISTEMEGYHGNILVIYDLADPAHPKEVSRWWMPGQHVAGGERPTWNGIKNRLHHAIRCGDELWAACWHAGIRVIDASDIANPVTVGSHDYHPWIPEPTHTVMPFEKPIAGRRMAAAIDEEHDHIHGRLHAFLWFFDASDRSRLAPISIFNLSELDSPFARAPGRFGAHQFHERLDSTLVYATWFSGGLRIVDVCDPELPEEVGYFIPEPLGGEPSPQSNDVAVGDDGTIYLIDRNRGLHILEFEGA